jgi:hypothetical protein
MADKLNMKDVLKKTQIELLKMNTKMSDVKNLLDRFNGKLNASEKK